LVIAGFPKFFESKHSFNLPSGYFWKLVNDDVLNQSYYISLDCGIWDRTFCLLNELLGFVDGCLCRFDDQMEDFEAEGIGRLALEFVEVEDLDLTNVGKTLVFLGDTRIEAALFKDQDRLPETIRFFLTQKQKAFGHEAPIDVLIVPELDFCEKDRAGRSLSFRQKDPIQPKAEGFDFDGGKGVVLRSAFANELEKTTGKDLKKLIENAVGFHDGCC
jgi:hypothetical protein